MAYLLTSQVCFVLETHAVCCIGKRRNKYNFAGVMGRTVDIAASVFGVEIPDLFYRGVVLKKDRAHKGML